MPMTPHRQLLSKFNANCSYEKKHDSLLKLWNGTDLEQNLPVTDFNNVMNSDAGLLEWLTNMQTYGIGFVKNTPANTTDTEALIRRISFIRETHYGVFCDTSAQMERSDTAYTNVELGLHTDNTYFTEPAGLQFFHNLTPGVQGGNSVFLDGFNAAEILKEKHPEHYEALTTLRISGTQQGEDTEILYASPLSNPVIELHPVTKKLFRIRYNNHDRDILSNLTLEQVEQYYTALHAWAEIIWDNKHILELKLEPGMTVGFDNWRVLHGRRSFVGMRRLCSAYIGVDYWRSRLRCLTKNSCK